MNRLLASPYLWWGFVAERVRCRRRAPLLLDLLPRGLKVRDGQLACVAGLELRRLVVRTHHLVHDLKWAFGERRLLLLRLLSDALIGNLSNGRRPVLTRAILRLVLVIF